MLAQSWPLLGTGRNDTWAYELSVAFEGKNQSQETEWTIQSILQQDKPD